MRTKTSRGGAPPWPPDLRAPTDEGPMRRELLRQIAHLEEQLSRFNRDNSPFEPMPAVRRRGPARLETASLEEIRDELLAVRAALHDRVVARAADRFDQQEQAAPRRRRLRLPRRLRP